MHFTFIYAILVCLYPGVHARIPHGLWDILGPKDAKKYTGRITDWSPPRDPPPPPPKAMPKPKAQCREDGCYYAMFDYDKHQHQEFCHQTLTMLFDSWPTPLRIHCNRVGGTSYCKCRTPGVMRTMDPDGLSLSWGGLYTPPADVEVTKTPSPAATHTSLVEPKSTTIAAVTGFDILTTSTVAATVVATPTPTITDAPAATVAIDTSSIAETSTVVVTITSTVEDVSIRPISPTSTEKDISTPTVAIVPTPVARTATVLVTLTSTVRDASTATVAIAPTTTVKKASTDTILMTPTTLMTTTRTVTI